MDKSMIVLNSILISIYTFLNSLRIEEMFGLTYDAEGHFSYFRVKI